MGVFGALNRRTTRPSFGLTHVLHAAGARRIAHRSGASFSHAAAHKSRIIGIIPLTQVRNLMRCIINEATLAQAPFLLTTVLGTEQGVYCYARCAGNAHSRRG